ncbi:hypothetical protein TNCV_3650541 [Trichonephila clavipes]|uniref:Uncharacterized protein n=1 Tax=Trichonephila clavipes TaxID=2585209 RepID=A0A8X6S4Z6_TRICX|nr:hypothetical protein TNCV_3650541 [Trichonephila clavipes]
MSTTTGDDTLKAGHKSSSVECRIQKSVGVRSRDRGGHRNLHGLLIILFSPNVCIKNSLTGLVLTRLDSFSAAIRAKRVCLRRDRPNLTRSSSDLVSQIAEQAL